MWYEVGIQLHSFSWGHTANHDEIKNSFQRYDKVPKEDVEIHGGDILKNKGLDLKSAERAVAVSSGGHDGHGSEKKSRREKKALDQWFLIQFLMLW